MTRTLGLRMFLPVMSASPLLTGCGDAGMKFAEDFWGVEAPGVKQYPYQAQFEAASKKFNVPVPILVAIGYSETRLYHVPGEESDIEGLPPTYGVMALSGDAISKGAELAGVPETDVQADPGANIMAAAALLDRHATTLDVDRDDLGAWAPAVAAFFDNPNLEASSHFIHEEVYRLLREGITAPEDSGIGEILKAVRYVTARFPFLHVTLRGGKLPRAFYSGAIWRPAPAANYTSGRRGHNVELLVVHTCAGSYTSCWGWLTSPKNPSKTSAHYVINETGSEISALVDEMDTAHHVGKSWQGQPTNPRSIGIEHGGFSYSLANQWTEGQLAASANLACDVVKRHNLVRDRNHILGHYQPDPVNRPNDPGIDFPWAVYMNRITECLGEPGGGKDGGKDDDGVDDGIAPITIDSTNENNDATVARVLPPSDNWKASTNVTGYYRTGYWVAPTAAVSDGVHFEFYLAAPASKEVFAWWTSADDRATAAPYVVFNAEGKKLGTVTKNQQLGGGAWQSLGTFPFTAGWNRVTVSRWTAAGHHVVADAIQIR